MNHLQGPPRKLAGKALPSLQETLSGMLLTQSPGQGHGDGSPPTSSAQRPRAGTAEPGASWSRDVSPFPVFASQAPPLLSRFGGAVTSELLSIRAEDSRKGGWAVV